VDQVKVGVIGCGNISDAYFTHMRHYPILDVIACADLNMECAQAKAEKWSLKALTVEQLLADPAIEIVVNLTIPAVHVAVNQQILAAGKHAYCEKPLALTRADGQATMKLADSKNLRVGSAPDTFMGSGNQLARKLIDEGAIGRVVAATAFMAGHGPEGWHPNPDFYYKVGGGPMFDMGPYYLTALVNLVGPMQDVAGMTTTALPFRVAGSAKHAGRMIKVETPTHLAGTIRHTQGAISTVIMSFDIWGNNYDRIEVHGTEGSLIVPDPNMFDGEVKLLRQNDRKWRTMKPAHALGIGRGTGVADMAYGIRSGRAHRASGQLALHVVDAMQAFDESSSSGKFVQLKSEPVRPAAIPAGLPVGTLD
jgi:predicted dehydrogenase